MNAKQRFLAGSAAVALALVALVLYLAGRGGSDDAGNPESELSVSEATAPLDGGPPELRAIRADANQLLGGGADSLRQRLDALRGTPVVVNNWASWCGPCRAEFPMFQAQASKLADRVAFLGVDSDDSNAAANTFLGELPLPYPSYTDPDNELKRDFFDSPVGIPNTAFYDRSGERVYVHQGPYADEAALAADIERYTQ
jgi:cytochrome c biogenesis protein CcmG, thiol:disulfide interchange protein DsbE